MVTFYPVQSNRDSEKPFFRHGDTLKSGTKLRYRTKIDFSYLGEDLSGKQRLTAQQKQRAEWAMAQKEERNRAEQLLKYSDYLYEMKQNQLDQKAMELQAKEAAARQQVNQATKEFNQRQGTLGLSFYAKYFCS